MRIRQPSDVVKIKILLNTQNLLSTQNFTEHMNCECIILWHNKFLHPGTSQVMLIKAVYMCWPLIQLAT